MCRLAVQFTFLVALLFVTGCARYQIPVQNDRHPASSHVEVSQIELSPVLDISQSITVEKQENHVPLHH